MCGEELQTCLLHGQGSPATPISRQFLHYRPEWWNLRPHHPDLAPSPHKSVQGQACPPLAIKGSRPDSRRHGSLLASAAPPSTLHVLRVGSPRLPSQRAGSDLPLHLCPPHRGPLWPARSLDICRIVRHRVLGTRSSVLGARGPIFQVEKLRSSEGSGSSPVVHTWEPDLEFSPCCCPSNGCVLGEGLKGPCFSVSLSRIHASGAVLAGGHTTVEKKTQVFPSSG